MHPIDGALERNLKNREKAKLAWEKQKKTRKARTIRKTKSGNPRKTEAFKQFTELIQELADSAAQELWNNFLHVAYKTPLARATILVQHPQQTFDGYEFVATDKAVANKVVAHFRSMFRSLGMISIRCSRKWYSEVNVQTNIQNGSALGTPSGGYLLTLSWD